MELGYLTITAIVLLVKTRSIHGHGRLWEPPSRSSMWRRGYNTSININDNELSCGGFTNHWIVNRGRCGVCGDPYQLKPRENEYGGTYASGLIVRTYPVGGTIGVIIGLTANHGGYFEFKLCPLRDATDSESIECMEKHKLNIINAEQEGQRYYIRDHLLGGEVHLTVSLPPGLVCKHCVLQWKYRTGSRWGCDSPNMCGQGFGPQEEFYGCADIAIASVAKTIFVLPKQPDNQDKVGLNDLGSKHQMKIDGAVPMKELLKPDIEFVVQKITKYNETVKDKLTGVKKQNIPPHILKYLQDRSYMENLLYRSIMTHYNHKLNEEPTNTEICTAVPEYQGNPIINEWCRNTCPSYPDLCSTSICKCTTNHRPQKLTNIETIQGVTGDQENLRSFVKELIRKAQKSSTENEQGKIAKNPLIPNHILNRSAGVSNTFGNSYVSDLSQTNLTGKSVIDRTQSLKSTKDTKHADTHPDKIPGFKCQASKKFAHNAFMANWCTKNCAFGFCPKSVCLCSY